MVDLLDRYEWTWYTTLTFRDIPKTYTAINRAKRWLNTLQCQEKRRIGYYICMEFTKLGTPHFHALMGNLDGVRRLTWMDKWTFGYARIYPYQVNLGASYYLTKYVVKSTYESGWYDLRGLEYLNQLTFDIKK